MKAMTRQIDDHGNVYQALVFWCPGCEELIDSGLHCLPVNSPNKTPQWMWDGNIEAPTLSPSILSHFNNRQLICHSFLRSGVFEYLGDCSHSMVGKHVPMSDLPEWTAWMTDVDPREQ